MKETLLPERRVLDVMYTEYMVKLKTENRTIIPASTTQCASTQAALDRHASRPKGEDKAYAARPLEIDATAVVGANTVEEAVGTRLFSARELADARLPRSTSKNTSGLSVLSGATKERRLEAVNAFMAHPSADPTDAELANTVLFKITQMFAPETIKAVFKKLMGNNGLGDTNADRDSVLIEANAGVQDLQGSRKTLPGENR